MMWTRAYPVAWLCGLALCLSPAPFAAGKIVYVDDDAWGANTGSSWTDAFLCLQDALSVAVDGDEIRVAQGTYKPDQRVVQAPGSRFGITVKSSGDRQATFQLTSGVTLKGGYAGLRAPDPNTRDIDAYQTILSGDLNGNDVHIDDPRDLLDEPSRADNSYHVVMGSNARDTSVLDGFIVTGGNANATESPMDHGGGMFCLMGSPRLTNCTFTGNRAEFGGGIYNEGQNPYMVSCAFSGNSARIGGGLYNKWGNPTAVNCVFSGNWGLLMAGGVYHVGGRSADEVTPAMINSTFSKNQASEGGGVFGKGALLLANCILWGNTDDVGHDESAQMQGVKPVLSHCCIQGWTGTLSGAGNHGADPLFVDADGADNVRGTEDDNLRLLGGSPCIDSGDSTAVPLHITEDMDGAPRFAEDLPPSETAPETLPVVDMGAYEGSNQGLLVSARSIEINEGKTATFTLALAMDPQEPIEVVVAVDSGDPDIVVQAPRVFVFDSSNYRRPRTVTLAAVGDSDYLHGLAVVSISARGLCTLQILVKEIDRVKLEVLHVDGRARGANDGTSWADAFTDLQEALSLAAATPGVRELRVAQGTYKPAGPDGSREAAFQMINNVEIRGGYAGITEREPYARDIVAYPTILSGDLGSDDSVVDDPRDWSNNPTRSENSYHVVTSSQTNPAAVLDGFTITGGTADAPWHAFGGGMLNQWGNPSILNCTFVGNFAIESGGGVYNDFSSPTIRNCSFRENAANRGGGIWVGTNLLLANCVFSQNVATTGGGAYLQYGGNALLNCRFHGNVAEDAGGAVYNAGSSVYANCVFSGNSAGHGACMYTDAGHPTLTNCTLVGNWAQYGSALACADRINLANCILWNGTGQIHRETSTAICNIAHSNVQGGWPGEGVIDVTPRFVEADGPDKRFGTDDDNLRLRAGSPCIDAGHNQADSNTNVSGVQPIVGVDVDLNIRRVDDPKSIDSGLGGSPLIDMGAYEFSSHPVSSSVYVDDDADGADTGTNWQDAFTDLQLALETASLARCRVAEIWVAAGTYVPVLRSLGVSPTTATFQLMNDLGIYGGFVGTETSVAQRDPKANRTVLSGDVNGDDGPNFQNRSDNRARVVTASYVDSTAVLDGFVITGGNSLSWAPDIMGGEGGAGLYLYSGSPTISRCIITGNSADLGAGIYCGQSDARFSECVIRANSAAICGGGTYCSSSAPEFSKCTFTENRAVEYGGGAFCSRSDPSFIQCNFSANTSMDAGGVYSDRGAPSFRKCVFTNNRAEHRGGALFGDGGQVILADSTFSGNRLDAVHMIGAEVNISGSVQLASNDLFGNNAWFQGDGVLAIQSDVVLSLQDCTLLCDVLGPGTIRVPLGSELTIGADALVDLGHETDLNGRIVCDGLLRVRDDAIVSNAAVNVTRASFEDNAIIDNCVIDAEAGAPYGQFFIEDSVQLWLDAIRADGDRYLDLDPRAFDCNNIHIDAINVQVTEGTDGTYGGLFELRGRDLPVPMCAPGEFLCPVGRVPDFSPQTWTLNRLELRPGTRLNLTNRFDFQAPYDSGGEYEVLYVRELILGPNSLLNTAFNQLYYETLLADPTAEIVNVPLLGFSLNTIAFDDENDFRTRVTHNNVVDEDGRDPDTTRMHVERIVGHDLDPNGVMRMCNLRDSDAGSPTYGQTINARAKGLFAKSSEDEIVIRFEYLFCDPAGEGELAIYLSDSPTLLDHADPLRDVYYLEVARLPHPPAGRPGAAGSHRWGLFELAVAPGHLDFVRGTRIEFELRGPEGTCILIDNWDPQVLCYGICFDVTGDNFVSVIDFLTVIGEYGSTAGLDPDPRRNRACLDGAFSEDGYVDLYDVLAWDWTLCSEGRMNLCYGVPLSGVVASTRIRDRQSRTAGGLRPATATGGDRDDLLILGKRDAVDAAGKLEDRLYEFDRSGRHVDSPPPLSPRCNVKLVRGHGDQLYLINSEAGVVRLDGTNTVVIPPGRTTYANEPRHNGMASVYVGIQGQGTSCAGRPILDVAFDQDYAYVVPVVVIPDGAAAYTAAAKLKLSDATDPPYEVVKLFDDPPPPADNQNRNSLREIELDEHGRLYVLNAHDLNESDILWRYNPDGTCERLDLRRLADATTIVDPIAMHMSQTTGMLYLASARCEPADPNMTVVYGFSVAGTLRLERTIAVAGMQHLTSITEDPVTGSLWAVGFNMIDVPQYPGSGQPAFYHPCFAAIPFGSDAAQAEPLSGLHDLALPISTVWTGPRADVSRSPDFTRAASRQTTRGHEATRQAERMHR